MDETKIHGYKLASKRRRLIARLTTLKPSQQEIININKTLRFGVF